ncbi:MAG: Rab geranylgeranyltransferase [Trizodia sp. TS-e1964]|nr:MAG: Rab geranylgeranyltransferase [Trizodia sp. TS-e1964]
MSSHGIRRRDTREAKTQSERRDEIDQITQYRELVVLIQTKISEKRLTAEVLALTSRLLQANPEYYTIWNYRRLILRDALFPFSSQGPTASTKPEDPSPPDPQQKILNLIREELQFLIPLLRRFPKCYWIWNHRRWLLQEAEARLVSSEARQLWTEELALVVQMLALDSRNFHGWGYRRTIVAHLESTAWKVAESGDLLRDGSMAEGEFKYTTKMIESNLSNFSAWHSRSKLIPRLLEERKADQDARISFLDDEIELITRALYTDPYDQSLWYYHRWLLYTLCSPSSHPSPQPPVFDLSDDLKVKYLSQELAMIRDILSDSEDCKHIYVALISYSQFAKSLQATAQSLDPISTDSRNISMQDQTAWLAELKKLDPLRKGRWEDWGNELGIEQ